MRLLRLHIALLCLFSAVCAIAQPRLEKPEFYLGFHGGVTASMVMFSPTVSQSVGKCLLAPNAGMFFRYYGHKYCAFQMELDYQQRGWHEKNTSYSRRLDYLELPILFHLYVGKKGAYWFFNIGPQIGYCIKDHKGDIPESVVIEDDEMMQYGKIDRPFDWGVTAGTGVEYMSKKAGTFFLEIRFAYSLGSIYSDRKTDYFGNSNPMTLSLNLGWAWKVK